MEYKSCRRLHQTEQNSQPENRAKIYVVLQGTESLIPLHCLSLDRNTCCLLRCCLIGHGDEELILHARTFLRNIIRSEN